MSTFHFTHGQPSDSVYNDIQALNKFSPDQLNEIFSLVFSILSQPAKAGDVVEHLEEFCKQHGQDVSRMKAMLKTAINIPKSALMKSLTPVHLKEDLISLGLSEEKASLFVNKYERELSNIPQSSLSQTLAVNQLVDMEWKFGVTAASSELSKVGNTFIQLNLKINKGSGIENVFMEMTLPQFYSFLHEMEKAKSSLDMLS